MRHAGGARNGPSLASTLPFPLSLTRRMSPAKPSHAYANCISNVTKCSSFFQHFCILLLPTGVLSNQYPQGYYPFEESPAKIPPKVRKPPYLQTSVPCPGVSDDGASDIVEPTLDNLCGDLNKGYLPLNPIGQSVEGVSYPL